MEVIFSVCMITATAMGVIWTIYFVLAMYQVRKTAKEIENAVKMIESSSPYIDLIFLAGGIISKVLKKFKLFR